MKSWKLAPRDKNVAKYIDCYWLLERKQSDQGYVYPKLNPDPAAHLLLACPQQRYRYSQDEVSFGGMGSHWISPHCKTFTMDHSQAFLVLGMKFHVGAPYSLNLHSPKAALDGVVDVDFNRLVESTAFDLQGFLAKASRSVENCCDQLDKLLVNLLSDIDKDKHAKLVDDVLPLLTNTPISELANALHCSQRTIERSFLRVTGLTLKQCQSMERLEAMLNYLYQLDGEHVSWGDIAAQFGFSDQAHLIRYLKNSIGTTPGAYAKQRDLAIDVYGDFE